MGEPERYRMYIKGVASTYTAYSDNAIVAFFGRNHDFGTLVLHKLLRLRAIGRVYHDAFDL